LKLRALFPSFDSTNPRVFEHYHADAQRNGAKDDHANRNASVSELLI